MTDDHQTPHRICSPSPIARSLVHRETVAPQGGAGFVVRTGGEGPTVHSVNGPEHGAHAVPTPTLPGDNGQMIVGE